MASHQSLNIVIVGAGLGGLAAAVALCNNGHCVTVFEATKELVTVSSRSRVTEWFSLMPNIGRSRLTDTAAQYESTESLGS